MSLKRGTKILLDAKMNLQIPILKPASAASRELTRFGDLVDT